MSLTWFENSHEIDAETHLLPDREDLNPTQTPLPTAQISILLTVRLAESVLSSSMGSYLSQLLRELPEVGGDARKVGYYMGIMVSLFCAAEAVTSFPWNRLSDYVGRKPVLLSCLVGSTLSMLLFGLSRSFWALVLSQCLHGAMMGHIGVVKIMTTELTDETNVAQGFSMLPLAQSLGNVIGPLVGGVLSRPRDRWPHIFSHPFWADYPYFLPCLVAAMFACLSLVITGLYLEETLDPKSPKKPSHARPNSDIPQEETGDIPDLDMTPPLRSVLTKPVVISVANYAMFALLGAVVATYIPLVWSTPVECGGLDLSPASIGLWLSVYAGICGFFQFAFFSRFVSRFGLRRVFVFSIVSCAVIYTLFPFENLAAVGGGQNIVVWLLIVLQISSYCVFDMGYSAMNMYVSSAALNTRSLGAVYGLSHVATSVLGTVGPAAAGWLFAFSLTHNVLGGTFAYIVLLGVVCVELGVSTQLPKNTWAHREE
ncbi:MFS general substrate transporter [Lactarius akahatsu]|uniref:MFS general substrate transporter n=1 Tax=Lactarius akahatsu TaxID=416441 RepID=A0AAD4L307_9AGAM|nr:MFS general substrate transporter [Lactarius akahatsu]